MPDSELGVADERVSAPTATRQLNTHGRWPWLLLLLACITVAALSFWHTLLLMVETWSHSRTFSHCFLILPLFFCLVWVRRRSIKDLEFVPNFLGLPLLGVLGFIWLSGNLAEVKVVQEFAVISILIAMVWTLFGTIVVRAFAFPLLFLYFAVPFGTSLVKPLQDFTAWFVIHALTITRVPAVLESHVISLPTGVWSVAEACSGIRFLLSSIVVGLVFACLMYRSPWRRLIFISASIVVPIIGNGVRAYGIILIAYLTNNKLAAGVDHIVYGGLFAVLIEVLLMVVGLRWRQGPEPDGRIAPDPRPDTALSARHGGPPGRDAFLVTAAALALIALAPFVASHLWGRTEVAAEWDDPPLMVTAPWQVTVDGDMGWAPEWHNPHKHLSQNYRYGTKQVGLDWVLYAGGQAMDPETPSDGLPSSKPWAFVGGGFGTAFTGGRRIEVYRSLMESGRVSRSVWTWYCVNGEYTANRTRVRFLRAKARFMGKPAAVAVTSLGADNQTNTGEADQVLQEFLQHVLFRKTAGPPAS